MKKTDKLKKELKQKFTAITLNIPTVNVRKQEKTVLSKIVQNLNDSYGIFKKMSDRKTCDKKQYKIHTSRNDHCKDRGSNMEEKRVNFDKEPREAKKKLREPRRLSSSY